jgi:erythronate-4-phosphate dehydrogenase
MKIVVDDKIPFLEGVLEPFADVLYLPGRLITRQHLLDADALLTRTRTRCDENLLKGTPVQFVGTATIGFDHIDTGWCHKNGIFWANAPGCNASSVNQYIASALLSVSVKFNFALADRTLGVIGVGHVGRRVVQTAEALGMRVYLCDPPRARSEGACGFISMQGILRESDMLTFHVPLTWTGQDKTWHIINDQLISRMNRGTILLNSSRGEVSDTQSLKSALKSGALGMLILDVWEHEPAIDTELMQLCALATPHIAGYSIEGKAKGTAMIVQALSRHFDWGLEEWEPANLPLPQSPVIHLNCRHASFEEAIRRAILATYNVYHDDQQLRSQPEDFEWLRENYPVRREFPAYSLRLIHGSSRLKEACRSLGFNIL